MLDGDAAEAHLSGAQRVPDWVPGFCPKVQHHNGNRGARRFPDLRSEGCDEGKGHRESTRTVSTGKTVSQTLRRVPGGTAEVRAPPGPSKTAAVPTQPRPLRLLLLGPGAGGGRAPGVAEGRARRVSRGGDSGRSSARSSRRACRVAPDSWPSVWPAPVPPCLSGSPPGSSRLPAGGAPRGSVVLSSASGSSSRRSSPPFSATRRHTGPSRW